MIARARVAGIAGLLALTTLLLWPLQAIAIRLDRPLARRLPVLWHRVAAGVAGIRVRTVGAPAADRPLLLVSNHQSWADVVVLGQAMELSFIAKEEVRSWPGFGLLARLHRTVFVARADRRGAAAQADAIAERLARGEAMVLFAEGTTSDGNGVLPFRTALFGAAEAALRRSRKTEMTVQPVSVAYLAANGMALGRFGRPLAAWPGAVTLGPHLFRFLAEGSVDAEIGFGAPIRIRAGDSRKALAKACEAAVRKLLAESLRNRHMLPGHALGRPPDQTPLASGTGGTDTRGMAQGTFQKGA